MARFFQGQIQGQGRGQIQGQIQVQIQIFFKPLHGDPFVEIQIKRKSKRKRKQKQKRGNLGSEAPWLLPPFRFCFRVCFSIR